MADLVPRLRMFAGPNGSGKSTIRNDLKPEWVGHYVNADEIEKTLLTQGAIPLPRDDVGFARFVERSELAKRIGLSSADFETEGGSLRLIGKTVDSYVASLIAEFIRTLLLDSRASFTFETVMSHRSKVELLRQARRLGYRTYLYYIATESPEVNVDRVALRVKEGGHDVPSEKVVERYWKSLDLLPEAIFRSDRTYLFDNSGDLNERVCFAEFEAGSRLSYRSSRVPRWFQSAVLDKLEAVEGSRA